MMEKHYNNILVVDDEINILEMIRMVLSEHGYNIQTAQDGQKALEILEYEKIDIILSDVKMPKITGYELLGRVKIRWPNIVFIIFTAFGELKDVVESMKIGAFDYLLKPITIDLLLLTIEKAVKHKMLLEEKERLKRENEEYQNNLEQLVEKKTKELEDETIGVLNSLITIVEHKDKYTQGHSLRVSNYSMLLGECMNLTGQDEHLLRNSSLLHDVGKIGISDAIINKLSSLTEEEYSIIKEHPSKGVEMLKPIPFCRDLLPIINAHHERYDGKGYPDRLAGKEIPEAARIIAIADTFDAMTSDRSYRKGLKPELVFEELKRCSGMDWDKSKTRFDFNTMQFDPEIMQVFLDNKDKFVKLLMESKDLPKSSSI